MLLYRMDFIQRKEKTKMTDTLLVSISSDKNGDNPILIVGRKEPNEALKIVNAFCGIEAVDIYRKLVTQNRKAAEI